MDINDLRDIVKQFDESTLTEFELRKADFELYLNKNKQPGRSFVCRSAENFGGAPVGNSSEVARKNSSETQSSVPQTSEKTGFEDKGEIIASPIVGVVYLKPSPDEKPFVLLGSKVSAEQTICIVEAMKMMNEIPAGVDGEIIEILAKNEQVVGIGDALFRIKV